MWKQNRSLFAYFRFMGYVMMIVGIYLIVNGIKDYAGQSRQKDWIPIEATVTDVSSEVVSSSPGRHGSNSSTLSALLFTIWIKAVVKLWVSYIKFFLSIFLLEKVHWLKRCRDWRKLRKGEKKKMLNNN